MILFHLAKGDGERPPAAETRPPSLLTLFYLSISLLPPPPPHHSPWSSSCRASDPLYLAHSFRTYSPALKLTHSFVCWHRPASEQDFYDNRLEDPAPLSCSPHGRRKRTPCPHPRTAASKVCLTIESLLARPREIKGPIHTHIDSNPETTVRSLATVDYIPRPTAKSAFSPLKGIGDIRV